MSYCIKQVTPDQFPEAVQVIRAAFRTVATEFGFTKENNPTHGTFIEVAKLQELYEGGLELFGLWDGARMVGFMGVKRKDQELFYLEKLAVVPEFRHQGYGEQLVGYAREHVKKAGGKRISISVINEQTILKQWYESLGFVEVRQKTFPHLSFTVCYMELSTAAARD